MPSSHTAGEKAQSAELRTANKETRMSAAKEAGVEPSVFFSGMKAPGSSQPQVVDEETVDNIPFMDPDTTTSEVGQPSNGVTADHLAAESRPRRGSNIFMSVPPRTPAVEKTEVADIRAVGHSAAFSPYDSNPSDHPPHHSSVFISPPAPPGTTVVSSVPAPSPASAHYPTPVPVNRTQPPIAAVRRDVRLTKSAGPALLGAHLPVGASPKKPSILPSPLTMDQSGRAPLPANWSLPAASDKMATPPVAMPRLSSSQDSIRTLSPGNLSLSRGSPQASPFSSPSIHMLTMTVPCPPDNSPLTQSPQSLSPPLHTPFSKDHFTATTRCSPLKVLSPLAETAGEGVAEEQPFHHRHHHLHDNLKASHSAPVASVRSHSLAGRSPLLNK